MSLKNLYSWQQPHSQSKVNSACGSACGSGDKVAPAGSACATAPETPPIYFMQGNKPAPTAIPYGNNPAHGHYVSSDDVKIYYETYGKGRPLVVLHGGGVGTPYEMGELIDKLCTRFQVIVVVSRGHGRSEIGHTPISFRQKAEDLYAVVKSLQLSEPCIILGFSDGGFTALKFASLYPKICDRVIALGAGTLEPGSFPADLKLADLEKIDPEFVRQQQKIMPEPHRWAEFLSAYMQFWHGMQIDADLLSAIQTPVLLVVGDEDDHAPVKTVLKAHQLLPNSSLCVIPKASHTVFLDNFKATYAALEAFIETPRLSLTGSKKLAANN